jgi:tripartite-type tricarboxylate transporter receptor subunit TctC
MHMKPLMRAAAAIAFAAIGTASAVAAGYPERPIEFVVPSSPGGGTDVMTRAFTDVARKYVSQPLVVTNKPGAGGGLGMGEVQRAAPDGYKVGVLISELAIIPQLGMAKFTANDFVAIARLNADPGTITVRAAAPWRTVEEFLAHARKNPGEVKMGNAGKVVKVLRDLARKTAEDPAFKDAMARNNLLLSYMEGEQFKPFMSQQSDDFKVLLGSVKIEK